MDRTGPLPSIVKVTIPTVPDGLDSQGEIVAKYTKDLTSTLLDGLQAQIAQLENAILLMGGPHKQADVQAEIFDTELSPQLQVRCAPDALHLTPPVGTDGRRNSMESYMAADRRFSADSGIITFSNVKASQCHSILKTSSPPLTPKSTGVLTEGASFSIHAASNECLTPEISARQVTFRARDSVAEPGSPRSPGGFAEKESSLETRVTRRHTYSSPGLQKSDSSLLNLFSAVRQDMESHHVMKMKERVRGYFTADANPLTLSANRLSTVLRRRNCFTEYDISELEAALRAMAAASRFVLAGDGAFNGRHDRHSVRATTANRPTARATAIANITQGPHTSGWTFGKVENEMISSTVTVSQRPLKADARNDSVRGIIDLDMFIKLLLRTDLVAHLEAYNGPEISECVQTIQNLLLEEETIDQVIDRLTPIEPKTSCKLSHIWRCSTWLDYLAVVVSIIAFAIELDDHHEWMGWFQIEILCTLVSICCIACEMYSESLVGYVCGEMWKWNLVDMCCTAIALGASVCRLIGGRPCGIRLAIAIRLLRASRMPQSLKVVPLLREGAIMLAGFVVVLPYVFWAVVLLFALLLITAVSVQLAVGPSVGQDLIRQCGTGDVYFSSGSDNDQCILVAIYSEEFFGSVSKSVMTTFRCLTGTCTTKAGLSLDLMFGQYYGPSFSIPYITLKSIFLFGLANVINAIFVDAMHCGLGTYGGRFKHFAHSHQGRVRRQIEKIKAASRQILNIEDDYEMPLNLTRSEFDIIMKDYRVRHALEELNVFFDDDVPSFDLFDFDGDEHVRERDLYLMILKMRSASGKADAVGTWLSLRDQRESMQFAHLAMLDAQQQICRQMQLRNAAVTLQRVEEVFEGAIQADGIKACLVSFPGKHIEEWQRLVRHCLKGRFSSACVYLPKSDPQKRYGKHAPNPEAPGSCYCKALYGEEQEWGCKWFHQWSENVKIAVSLKLELVVVFFEGQRGRGMVDWRNLSSTNLWDGIGLGGSQKGEVAWLTHQGYAFTSMDLREAIDRFDLDDASTNSCSPVESIVDHGMSSSHSKVDSNNGLSSNHNKERTLRIGALDCPDEHAIKSHAIATSTWAELEEKSDRQTALEMAGSINRSQPAEQLVLPPPVGGPLALC